MIIIITIIQLCICCYIDSDIVKHIICVVKDVLRAHSIDLSQILEPQAVMKDFANRMLQADFIGDTVARSPEYQVIVNDFLSCFRYTHTKQQVERDCSKLLGILKDIGGPCKRAGEAIKHDLIEGIKNKCNTELALFF